MNWPQRTVTVRTARCALIRRVDCPAGKPLALREQTHTDAEELQLRELGVQPDPTLDAELLQDQSTRCKISRRVDCPAGKPLALREQTQCIGKLRELTYAEEQQLRELGIQPDPTLDAELLQLGIQPDRKVTCWFVTNTDKAKKMTPRHAGQWEHGRVTRADGTGSSRAFYVSYDGTEWPDPVLFSCKPEGLTWRCGWPAATPCDVGEAYQVSELPEADTNRLADKKRLADAGKPLALRDSVAELYQGFHKTCSFVANGCDLMEGVDFCAKAGCWLDKVECTIAQGTVKPPDQSDCTKSGCACLHIWHRPSVEAMEAMDRGDRGDNRLLQTLQDWKGGEKYSQNRKRTTRLHNAATAGQTHEKLCLAKDMLKSEHADGDTKNTVTEYGDILLEVGRRRKQRLRNRRWRARERAQTISGTQPEHLRLRVGGRRSNLPGAQLKYQTEMLTKYGQPGNLLWRREKERQGRAQPVEVRETPLLENNAVSFQSLFDSHIVYFGHFFYFQQFYFQQS